VWFRIFGYSGHTSSTVYRFQSGQEFHLLIQHECGGSDRGPVVALCPLGYRNILVLPIQQVVAYPLSYAIDKIGARIPQWSADDDLVGRNDIRQGTYPNRQRNGDMFQTSAGIGITLLRQ
jgi:hypothetical protein